MAAGRWVGRGDKNGADGVAVNAMRQLINTVPMNHNGLSRMTIVPKPLPTRALPNFIAIPLGCVRLRD